MQTLHDRIKTRYTNWKAEKAVFRDLDEKEVLAKEVMHYISTVESNLSRVGSTGFGKDIICDRIERLKDACNFYQKKIIFARIAVKAQDRPRLNALEEQLDKERLSLSNLFNDFKYVVSELIRD